MVSELVHEDVGRLGAVGRDRSVLPKDAAAAVGPRVRQNLDEFVRGERGGLAQGAVLERQHVAFGSECVVGRSERRGLVAAG